MSATSPIPTTVFATDPQADALPQGPCPGAWRIAGVAYRFSFALDIDSAGRPVLHSSVVTGPNGGRYTVVHVGGDLFELWSADREYRPVRRKRTDAGAPVQFRIFRGHIVPADTPTSTFDPRLVAYDQRVDIFAGDTIVHLKTDGTLSTRVAQRDERAGIDAGHNRFDWFPYSPSWVLPQALSLAA